MKKLIVFLICAAAVFNGLCAAGEERQLSRSEIPVVSDSEGLAELGIMHGTEKGLELEREITRAEALTLLQSTLHHTFNAISYIDGFEDTKGHWARDLIEAYRHEGFVSGTSDTTFEPERSVTGAEFVCIMLRALGYKDVRTDNAYDKGVQAGILENNFTKSVVKADMPLLRSDAVRLCRAVLTAKYADGGYVYERLIAEGYYKQSDFDGILFTVCPGDTQQNGFSDKLNAMMPEDKNYMFSPLSISCAFAMAANGAAGETQQQILDALGIEDLNEFNKWVGAMIEKYEEAEAMELSVANSVWVNKSMTDKRFLPSFSEKLNKYFAAESETVDASDAVDKINSWVSDKTKGKISKIISKPEFTAMLVNAVYFKADWQSQFDEYLTQKREFTQRDKKVKETDFMQQLDYMDYFSGRDTTIVRLPYKNYIDGRDSKGKLAGRKYDDNSVAMYLIMGKGAETPSATIDNTKLVNGKVRLFMPKFKSEFTTSLNDIMQKLGVENAYTPLKADFSPMIDEPDLVITDAIHKTYIDVYEKGTEAAAVTAIVGMVTGAAPVPEHIEEIRFNRPFAYVIRDETNEVDLFVGEYAYVEE